MSNEDYHDERLRNIRDIQRRIGELRDALHRTRSEPTQRNDQVPQENTETRVGAAESSKNTEMEDLKSKLLRRKK